MVAPEFLSIHFVKTKIVIITTTKKYIILTEAKLINSVWLGGRYYAIMTIYMRINVRKKNSQIDYNATKKNVIVL